MKSIYKSYKCSSCKREMVLLSEYVDSAIKNGKYLSCAYCGCKYLKREKESDSLKECMRTNSYKRVRGALRQVKQE